MKAAIALSLATALAHSGCASVAGDHGRSTEAAAIKIFDQFARLQPPISATRARRLLGDPSWMRNVAVHRQTSLFGWMPIRKAVWPGSTFVIELMPSRSQSWSGYSICVHTTQDFAGEKGMRSLDDFPESPGLRRFFAGDAPKEMQIDELALCYPDGRILYSAPGHRKMLPPNTYDLDFVESSNHAMERTADGGALHF